LTGDPSTVAEERGIREALELVVFWQDHAHKHELPECGDVTIGRAERNIVRVDHPSVSRHHAVLSLGSRIVLRDLGSQNGTFLREPASVSPTADTVGLRRLAADCVDIAIGETMIFGEVTALIRRQPEPPSSFRDLREDQESESGVVVRDPKMKAVYAEAEQAARAMITLLILGETGVGKELLARAVHARSKRASGPYVSVNCAAFSESLLEGELFGHEKGAFTGATEARAGVFEAAHGGTLFLDEIGEVAASIQAKLLRVLEERSITRLGARRPRPIDVRFVAATNRDLEAEVRNGRFRQDLFFRLNGMTLTIPPLRERPSDIQPLVQSLVRSACRQLDRTDALPVSGPAMELLRAYAWPGNVRELRNVIERAVVLCNQRSIGPEHLPPALVRGRSETARAEPVQGVTAPEAPPPAAPSRPPTEPSPIPEAGRWQTELKALERLRLTEALERCAGNQTAAAKLLGISRRTLVSRLSEYGMPRPRKRQIE
jgi:DNA-binding NtrC family response regulator